VLEAVSDNVFDYITYHQYPCCLPSAAFAADPTCMQQVDDAATAVVSDGITNNKPMAIWAGETSNCAGGGRVGYSDSFSDIFYYMYQLCVLPLLGVPLAARQAFVGGDYELLSRFNSTAHPSFWVAYLYGQHLAGAATYQVSQSVSSVTTGLRVFGFVDAENAKIAV
ncbi:Heparanase-like protein 1, partial [Diplonema papillatum]